MSSPSSASSVSPRPSRNRPPPSIPPILRRAHDAGAQGPTPLLTTSRSVFCSRRRLVPVHAGRALGVRLRAAHAAAFVTAALMFVTSRAVQFSPSVPRAPALRASTRGTAPAACTPTPNRVASARRPGRARPAGSARPLSMPARLQRVDQLVVVLERRVEFALRVSRCRHSWRSRLLPSGWSTCLSASFVCRYSVLAHGPCGRQRARRRPRAACRQSSRRVDSPTRISSNLGARSTWTLVPSANRKFRRIALPFIRVAQLDRETESRRPSPISRRLQEFARPFVDRQLPAARVIEICDRGVHDVGEDR